MLHCYNCGTDLPDNMIYCTTCGKKLDVPEFETKVLGGAAAPTVGYPAQVTQPMPQAKKRSGFRTFILVFLGLAVTGAVVVVVGAVAFFVSRKQAANAANLARANINVNVSVNSTPTPDANVAINDAINAIQKAANDALAAANQAANISIKPPAGKTLDNGTNRITFRPGATSATAAGIVEENATFVLRAKEGQTLRASMLVGGNCIKFSPDESSLSLTTESGDNEIEVVNTCGKPTAMVMSITIK